MLQTAFTKAQTRHGQPNKVAGGGVRYLKYLASQTDLSR